MAPLDDSQIDELLRAAERVEETKQAHKDAKSDRERVITNIAATGASYREIAEYAGLSYQRIAQLLTGEKGAYFPQNGASVAWCPRCEAPPSSPCIDVNKAGKRTERAPFSHHIQRYHRFYDLMEGREEPRPDEPGPLTAIYSPMEAYRYQGVLVKHQAIGPCFLDPKKAAAYLGGDEGHVGVWNGQDWQEAEF